MVMVRVIGGKIEQALKVFKKRWEDEGIKTELKNRKGFMSRGEKRRRQQMRGRARQREKMRIETSRNGSG